MDKNTTIAARAIHWGTYCRLNMRKKIRLSTFHKILKWYEDGSVSRQSQGHYWRKSSSGLRWEIDL